MPINRKILREIDKDLERHVPEPPDWKDVVSNFKVRERHAVGHLVLLCHIDGALFRIGGVNGSLSFFVTAFENAIELGDIRDTGGEQLLQSPLDVGACQQG
jgi:hypothetical protein